jgi:hypothetical protein
MIEEEFMKIGDEKTMSRAGTIGDSLLGRNIDVRLRKIKFKEGHEVGLESDIDENEKILRKRCYVRHLKREGR